MSNTRMSSSHRLFCTRWAFPVACKAFTGGIMGHSSPAIGSDVRMLFRGGHSGDCLPTEVPRSPEGGSNANLSAAEIQSLLMGINPELSASRPQSQHFAADMRQCVGALPVQETRLHHGAPLWRRPSRICLSPYGEEKRNVAMHVPGLCRIPAYSES